MGAMTASIQQPGYPPGPLTVADLEAMPDDGHGYELLDGVLIVTPAPGWSHQRAVGRLFRLLDDATPAGLEALPAPFAVRPEGGLPLAQQRTELQPDVLVARVSDLTARDLPAAPVLVVEVASPSTRLVDVNLKRAAYARMGVHHYWIVDPEVPDLSVFALAGEEYRLVAKVSGHEAYEALAPVVVTVCPADLVRPR